ncbi:MAG: c-type cytochrome [Planctomycetaceae bacterium]|nr:c-type cytochrome [Planctomycetaceae bacterium]
MPRVIAIGGVGLRCLCVALVCLAAWWSLNTLSARAEKPAPESEPDYSDELPRIPPHEPADALETFETLPGFRIEQVAAEPLVHSPVAISFDEAGRMYVVEMIDYSEQGEEFLGTVRLLEDTNRDGRFDKSTLFADKLSWPTAIVCYDGGVFVGAAPDIYYLKDTDGDGQADVRQTVFTGFGRSNVQGLFNSFHWGLDNRIHGATSTSGAQVVRPDAPDAPPINLNGRDFAFDPKTLDLVPTSGGAQHGMSFDDWGRKFLSSNSDHLQFVMYDDRYVARNPHLAAPNPRISIAADGPQAEVFRISPVEPWRIVRTRLRASGQVPGIVEGGGRPAGYFTGATGGTIYRGDAWPVEYRGQAFVGDVGSNIVHRKGLEPDGVGLIARRLDEKREFVASTDIWFRPAQFANAPDGNLYIIDVYREVIEHPASLPPVIKKHLDLTSGRERGRIYRVVRNSFRQPPPPRLHRLSTPELVATLEFENGWHRDTASRLLYQRQDREAIEPLHRLARASTSPQARLHALYALEGLKALTVDDLVARLADEHPRVREQAVRLAESLAGESAPLRETLYSLVADPDLRVRYQLAFTLGELPERHRIRPLTQLLTTNGADRWIRLAAFSSLSEGIGEVLAELSQDEAFRSSDAGRETLAALAMQAGLQARQGDVLLALTSIEALPDAAHPLSGQLVTALLDGLTRRNSALKELVTTGTGKSKALLAEALKAARTSAADTEGPPADRAEAIRTLRLGTFAVARDLLPDLLGIRQPQEVQLAALATLTGFTEPEIGPILIEAWPTFSPRLRTAATEAVFSRPAWLLSFMQAVARDEIPAADVEPGRVKLLSAHSDPAVREEAKLLGDRLKLGRRQEVLEAYKSSLTLTGNSAKGKLHFQKICAVCHRLENFGTEIGPNLATVQNRGAETIWLNMLDPNREVNPQFVNYLALLTDGKTISGLIAAETATSVTLKRQENATDVILRVNLDELRSTGLSIMPEGVEKQLDQQEVADVIAYLLSVK